MAVLHVKSPNGTQNNINLDKIVLANNNQTISGLKTFDKIDFNYGWIAGFKYGAYGETSGTAYNQLMISAQSIGWSDPGAKITLHQYSSSSAGTNGNLSLLANNGSQRAELCASVADSLKLNGNKFFNEIIACGKSSSGIYYIRHTATATGDGFQIQSGAVKATTSGVTVNLPQPWNGDQFTLILFTSDPNVIPRAANKTTTSFKCYVNTSSSLVFWLSIGQWW